MDTKNIRFNVIRVHNTPNKATLEDGFIVERREKVFIAEEGGEVVCAPYSNHFVFLDPHKISRGSGIKYWFSQCSCGGPAVLVGSKAYAHLGSANGKMLVCYLHTLRGTHADGSS